jgi:predicted O-methyltransferase YrrM
LDEVFERNYRLVDRFTMLIKPQVRSIFDRLIEVRRLPGDVIEFGAYQGAVSFFLALCIRDLGLGKKVWMLDSFAGLPEPDPSIDGAFTAGTMASNLEAVTRMRTQLGLDRLVEIRAGWFDDSVMRIGKNVTYCLAHLDADLYSSTRTALEHVLPRLVEGGALVLDDCLYFGASGVVKAVHDVLGPDIHLHLGPKTQAFAYPKGDPRLDPPAAMWKTLGGRAYDVADLLTRHDYRELVSWEANFCRERATLYEAYIAEILGNGEPGAESHKIASTIGFVRRS